MLSYFCGVVGLCGALIEFFIRVRINFMYPKIIYMLFQCLVIFVGWLVYVGE